MKKQKTRNLTSKSLFCVKLFGLFYNVCIEKYGLELMSPFLYPIFYLIVNGAGGYLNIFVSHLHAHARFIFLPDIITSMHVGLVSS